MRRSNESDKAVRITRLYQRAIEVLGDHNATHVWLKSPVKGLGNKTPLGSANTKMGAQKVENLLNRIEDGIYF